MSPERNGKWLPWARELHLEWYLKLLMRYVVGPVGLVWEAFVRGGADPLLILAFTLLATSVDAFSLTRGLIRWAKDEEKRMPRETGKDLERNG